jgi:pilus assembly protein Flp/PilA
MMDLMRSFWKDESGQDMAEYALLLALIALVLIVAITAFRGAIQNRFNEATTQLNSAGS